MPIGAIDFTGDMPILLGPDGPSLGGFVCPAVVAREDLWKLGQLKPGDSVRFVPAERPEDDALALPNVRRKADDLGSPILAIEPGEIPAVYRRQGDDNILVEYGPMALDIALRLRVHLLASAVAEAKLDGLIDLTPGIRSLQVHYDGTRVKRAKVLGLLREIERGLPACRRRHRAEPHRPPAAVVERSAGAAGDAALPGDGAARCAVVPVEHRVHPPHQRARQRG